MYGSRATTLAVNPSIIAAGNLSSTINSDSYNAGITLDSVTVRDSEFTWALWGELQHQSADLKRCSATSGDITRLSKTDLLIRTSAALESEFRYGQWQWKSIVRVTANNLTYQIVPFLALQLRTFVERQFDY